MTCHFCRRADLWLYLTCGVCQLTTHAKCYYKLGSDEATYYETHSSDWRCQDCGGPQRHADSVISNDEQVIQRHVGPRLPNRGYPASGHDDVAAGAAKNLRSDGFLSDNAQLVDFRLTTGGLHSSERGGGAAGSAPSSHRPIMRRDKESIDCDMLDLSNAEPSTPLKHLMTTADGSPLLTDAMLVDQDESNPRIGDCSMPIEPPPLRERGPTGKKRLQRNNSRHGHKKPCEYKGRKQSGKPS